MNVMETLQGIFREIFDDDDLALHRETTASDIDEWDSLAQINIIVACEEAFGLKFNLNDIAKLKNVGDMVDLVEGKKSGNRF